MNPPDDLDRLLIEWLADEGPRDTSARLARAAVSEAGRTRRARPLPRVLAPLIGDPLETVWRRPSLSLGRPAVVLLALLLLAAATVLVAGAMRFLPPLLPHQPATYVAPPPGGGLLAWDADGDINVGTIEGDTWTLRMSTKEYAPSWAPDGRRLAFWSELPDGSTDLEILDLVEGSFTTAATLGPGSPPILSDPGGGVAWSPDGRFVAYATGDRKTGTITIVRGDGQVWDGNDGQAPTIALDGRGVYDPVFAPDGGSLTFAAHQPSTDTVERWLIPMASDGTPGEPGVLSRYQLPYPGGDDVGTWLGAYSFARAVYSADGRTILTVGATSRGRGGVMVLIAADGSAQRAIAEPGKDIGPGAWSADGNRLAYLRHVGDAPERGVLVLAAADGSSPVDVPTDMDFNSLPAWSPDGSAIALREARGTAIVVVGADPGPDGSRQVTTVAGTGMIGDPVFQPVAVALPRLRLGGG